MVGVTKAFPMTEAVLAAKVVAKLEAQGYSVYQEVEGDVGRADIVAVCGWVLLVVECKMVLGFEVMAQARKWQPYASSVYVAVPKAKPSEGRSLAIECCGRLELGVYVVSNEWAIDPDPAQAVRERETPAHRETFNPRLRERLRPEHQTHAKAGTKEGGQFTPFKQTCYALRAYAEAHPGDLLRVALSRCEHHYKSIGGAISSLVEIAGKGDLAKFGIELKAGADEAVRVYPAEVP